MKFTDLFIKRPVLAATVSLLILVLGLRAVTSLPIRQYPKTESATIVVQTVYFGADAQTMGGFITQPLEQAIAQAGRFGGFAMDDLVHHVPVAASLKW